MEASYEMQRFSLQPLTSHIALNPELWNPEPRTLVWRLIYGIYKMNMLCNRDKDFLTALGLLTGQYTNE